MSVEIEVPYAELFAVFVWVKILDMAWSLLQG